jgi:hypothetical protein
MSEEPRPLDPGGAAREEAARQAVAAAAGLLFIGAAAVLQRWLSAPDRARELRMRAAKAAERLSARLAGQLWQFAERARRDYEAER